MNSLQFTYAGIVESNRDPIKLGRLKVRVPHVFGSDSTGSGYIGTNELPWALPAGLPAGGTALSGGLSMLPEPGDKVWVRFLDGEPEKPIWEWGMQTRDDSLNMPLHSYAAGSPVGSPDRTIWTRYGHALEINEGSIIGTTSQGYRIVLTDSSEVGANDGQIDLTTLLGNMITLNDLDSTIKVVSLEDIYLTAMSGLIGTSDSFSWRTMSQNYSVTSGGGVDFTSVQDIELNTASNFSMDAIGSASLTTSGSMTLGFSTLQLGLNATEPAVLGALLSTFLTNLLTWLNTHTHTSGAPGSPTSPPLIPPEAVVLPQPAQLLSSTVTVQN